MTVSEIELRSVTVQFGPAAVLCNLSMDHPLALANAVADTTTAGLIEAG